MGGSGNNGRLGLLLNAYTDPSAGQSKGPDIQADNTTHQVGRQGVCLVRGLKGVAMSLPAAALVDAHP